MSAKFTNLMKRMIVDRQFCIATDPLTENVRYCAQVFKEAKPINSAKYRALIEMMKVGIPVGHTDMYISYKDMVYGYILYNKEGIENAKDDDELKFYQENLMPDNLIRLVEKYNTVIDVPELCTLGWFEQIPEMHMSDPVLMYAAIHDYDDVFKRHRLSSGLDCLVSAYSDNRFSFYYCSADVMKMVLLFNRINLLTIMVDKYINDNVQNYNLDVAVERFSRLLNSINFIQEELKISDSAAMKKFKTKIVEKIQELQEEIQRREEEAERLREEKEREEEEKSKNITTSAIQYNIVSSTEEFLKDLREKQIIKKTENYGLRLAKLERGSRSRKPHTIINRGAK